MSGVSDEYLQASSVGGPPPEYQEIVIADYDPDWPRWFEAAAGRIRAVLGKTALELHHVGSTSVPGLPAKPLIDIDLVVPDTERIKRELGAKEWKYVQNYADAKTAVVEEVLARASGAGQ